MIEFFFVSFICLSIVSGWMFSSMNGIQASTLWLSKFLIENEIVPIKNTVNESLKRLQALLTPSFHTIKQIIFPLLIVLMIVNGALIRWYFVPIGFICIIVISLIINVFNNKNLYTYLDLIKRDLRKKQLKFRGIGDTEKVIFIENLLTNIQVPYQYAKDNNITIKSI